MSRRSRVVDLVRDWTMLGLGTAGLVRDMFFVKEWRPDRFLLVMVEVGLMTGTFLTPGGLWQTVFERLTGIPPATRTHAPTPKGKPGSDEE